MDTFENGVSYCVQAADSIRQAFDAARTSEPELSDYRRFYVRNPRNQQPLSAILAELKQEPALDLRTPRGALSVFCVDDGSYVFVHKAVKDIPLLCERLCTALLSLDGFTPPNGLMVAEAPLWERWRVCEIRGLESGVGLANVSDRSLRHVPRDAWRTFRIVDSRESIDALLYCLRERLGTHVSYAWDPKAREVLIIEGRVVRERGCSTLELLVEKLIALHDADAKGGAQ